MDLPCKKNGKIIQNFQEVGQIRILKIFQTEVNPEKH